MCETLIYFGLQNLEMNKYSIFNCSALNYFDVLNLFYADIET